MTAERALDPKVLRAMQDECVDRIETVAKEWREQRERQDMARMTVLGDMESELEWLNTYLKANHPVLAAWDSVYRLRHMTRLLKEGRQYLTTGVTPRKDQTES